MNNRWCYDPARVYNQLYLVKQSYLLPEIRMGEGKQRAADAAQIIETSKISLTT